MDPQVQQQQLFACGSGYPPYTWWPNTFDTELAAHLGAEMCGMQMMDIGGVPHQFGAGASGSLLAPKSEPEYEQQPSGYALYTVSEKTEELA